MKEFSGEFKSKEDRTNADGSKSFIEGKLKGEFKET